MWGFPASSASKESICNAGGPESIPECGRRGNSNQLQYSCLGKMPWTEEHERLQSMGSQRVGHDVATKPPSSDEADLFSGVKVAQSY